MTVQRDLSNEVNPNNEIEKLTHRKNADAFISEVD